MRHSLKAFFALAAFVVLNSSPSFAKTLDFPNKGDAMFRITIPDSWEPDSDEDEVVEATSPKNHVQLAIWQIESKEELKNLGNEIVEILDDHAKDIKLVGEPEKVKPAGMDGLLFAGSAVDNEDDHAIEFVALLLVSDSKVAVVYIEADADTPKKELEKLTAILKSISKPAKK